MARTESIGRQVQKIIKVHDGIGRSKLASREMSGIKSLESSHKLSNEFHSYKSIANARQELTDLGKYAKETHQIKNISEITAATVKNWIESKDIGYRTASNYLSNLNKTSEHMNFTRNEIKEIRESFRNKLKRPKKETRAYKSLEKIIMPERSQPAFELQRDYGLRVNASTHININKQINDNTLSYQQKGGKWSEIELSPTLVSKIKENAVNGKYEINNRTYSRDLKKEIERTGQKYNGTHGIRHSYAQNQLDQGKTKREVSEAMGHTREEIVNVYLR